MTTRVGLYVHIPFCPSKCSYCDFASFPGLNHLYVDYVLAAQEEARRQARAWAGAVFDTIYVGGGTPTVLPAESLLQLLGACREVFDLTQVEEITVEANPGTVSETDLRVLRAGGVNRLSLGVQSFRDDELRMLGRAHTTQQAIEAVEMARRAGYANLSLDLMFGLPGQTLAHWEESLAMALYLRPEHLSLYALTPEAGTPLADRISEGVLPPVDDDLAARMYERAEEALETAGYRHYEISNWALGQGDIPPLVCRHNLTYWRNAPYLGLGAAACSYDGRRRWGNVEHPAEYVRRLHAGVDPTAYEETLGREAAMGETVMLGLRLVSGIDAQAFSERFGASLWDVYAEEIDEFVEAGLLAADRCGIRLTRRGRLLGNRVFAAFLRDATTADR